MSSGHNHNRDSSQPEIAATSITITRADDPIVLGTDCAVPGFNIGDTVYIRGRIVALCKCPFGYGKQIAAQPIDASGNRLDGTVGVYFIDPRHAVNAAVVKSEVRQAQAQAREQQA